MDDKTIDSLATTVVANSMIKESAPQLPSRWAIPAAGAAGALGGSALGYLTADPDESDLGRRVRRAAIAGGALGSGGGLLYNLLKSYQGGSDLPAGAPGPGGASVPPEAIKTVLNSSPGPAYTPTYSEAAGGPGLAEKLRSIKDSLPFVGNQDGNVDPGELQEILADIHDRATPLTENEQRVSDIGRAAMGGGAAGVATGSGLINTRYPYQRLDMLRELQNAFTDENLLKKFLATGGADGVSKYTIAGAPVPSTARDIVQDIVGSGSDDVTRFVEHAKSKLGTPHVVAGRQGQWGPAMSQIARIPGAKSVGKGLGGLQQWVKSVSPTAGNVATPRKLPSSFGALKSMLSTAAATGGDVTPQATKALKDIHGASAKPFGKNPFKSPWPWVLGTVGAGVAGAAEARPELAKWID